MLVSLKTVSFSPRSSLSGSSHPDLSWNCHSYATEGQFSIFIRQPTFLSALLFDFYLDIPHCSTLSMSKIDPLHLPTPQKRSNSLPAFLILGNHTHIHSAFEAGNLGGTYFSLCPDFQSLTRQLSLESALLSSSGIHC